MAAGKKPGKEQAPARTRGRVRANSKVSAARESRSEEHVPKASRCASIVLQLGAESILSDWEQTVGEVLTDLAIT